MLLKMSDKNTELFAFLSKYGALFTYILIGVVGKFGFDLVSGKKISGWYVFGTGCIAIFVGWISWEWCARWPALNPGLVVPIATLLSRDILLFITMMDWQGVLKILTGKSKSEK